MASNLYFVLAYFGGGIDMENREDGISNPGKDSAGTLDAQIRLGLATGGEFVLNLANTFLWDLSGGSGETASGLLGFRFVQPLLARRTSLGSV